MFDSLSTRLQDVFKTLRGEFRLTPENIEAALREFRLALLEADVNFKVVKDFVAKLRSRAIGGDVLTGLNPGQQIVKLVHEELVTILGGARHQLKLDGRPAVILMVGVMMVLIPAKGRATIPCHRCRYDLTGNTSDRCPECGRIHGLGSRLHHGAHHRRDAAESGRTKSAPAEERGRPPT